MCTRMGLAEAITRREGRGRGISVSANSIAPMSPIFTIYYQQCKPFTRAKARPASTDKTNKCMPNRRRGPARKCQLQQSGNLHSKTETKRYSSKKRTCKPQKITIPEKTHGQTETHTTETQNRRRAKRKELRQQKELTKQEQKRKHNQKN